MILHFVAKMLHKNAGFVSNFYVAAHRELRIYRRDKRFEVDLRTFVFFWIREPIVNLNRTDARILESSN